MYYTAFDVLVIAVCAALFGVIVGWPLGRAMMRRERARWSAAPDFNHAPPPTTARLLTDAPPFGVAPPPITAAIARRVNGEIVIALVEFERSPATPTRYERTSLCTKITRQTKPLSRANCAPFTTSKKAKLSALKVSL